jgi:hypothetical protein
MFKFILLTFMVVLTADCMEIEPPSPKEILAPWSGTPPVQLGESKDSVRDSWGDPDEIRQLGADDIGIKKEEWIYDGRSNHPLRSPYISSKTIHLIFTGDSLTAYEATGGSTKAEVKE